MIAGDARYEQLVWDLMRERQGPVVHEYRNPRPVERPRTQRVSWDTLEEIAKRRREMVAEMQVVRDRRVAS